MSLSCGCEIRGGMRVDGDMLQEHYKHTMECLLFWELMYRDGVDASEGRMALSQARLDYMGAIDKLYPEAFDEND